jgi:DNA-binding response OmpR family regulator
VVLVDDDGTALRVLGDILVDDGCVVRSYPDSRSALAAMAKEPPDVLVADWLMPGMDGPDLLREVRSSSTLRGTYCVLVTAHDGEGKKVEGLLAGADDYLAKPVSPAELLARVRVGLRVRRLERQSMMLAVAATLGHEINNPLTGVLGYLELVRVHVRSGDRERTLADIERIEKAAERIRAVVARLLELEDPRLKPYLPGTMMIDLEKGGPPVPPPE